MYLLLTLEAFCLILLVYIEQTRLNESLTATQNELAATRASLLEAQRSLADARADHSQALATAQSHWAAQLDTCSQSHAAQIKVAHEERETAIQRLTEDAKSKAERDAAVLTQAHLEIQVSSQRCWFLACFMISECGLFQAESDSSAGRGTIDGG
jgi:biopolymer transport protein ExbB/TolQ